MTDFFCFTSSDAIADNKLLLRIHGSLKVPFSHVVPSAEVLAAEHMGFFLF